MQFTILNFDTIDSTNTEALRQAKLGADEGLCIVARQQTAGRGRHGRVWSSPKDAGLYFSIVLRPQIETRSLPLITLMAGVAVHETLAEIGLRPDIKWVNDVLVNERKISGILAETTDSAKGLAVIVGIGINLTLANFPAEISDTATSVESELGHTIAAADLTDALTRNIAKFYDVLNAERGPREIVLEWQNRSSYFSGKHVRVVLEHEAVTGVTDGLGSNGALRLKLADGTLMTIQTGDVQQIRASQ